MLIDKEFMVFSSYFLLGFPCVLPCFCLAIVLFCK
nr:MAG TPA: hypothetical protein [Caudoviricetes sp.]DAU61096.1 MAG TPA: hypothetical protein [Caudoviricetes sp.]